MVNKMKKELKKDILTITILFLISRLFLLFFLVYKHNFSFFSFYDAEHFISIAKNGYSSELLFAFFPLFPLLIRTLHFIIPSYETSSLILSNSFSFLSIITLYYLVKDDTRKNTIIFAFIFSPILVFNMIGYTESLYLFLTLLSFYLYKKKKYLFCGIALGLSMLTRNTGIILLGVIGLHMLYKIYKKEIKIKDLLLLSIPAFSIGFLYSIYLLIYTNDFFKYITVQYTEWGRDKSNLFIIIIRDIKFLISNFNNSYLLIFLENWIFFFLGLFVALKNLKKEFVLSLYLLISLLLISTTCRVETWITLSSISFFRYVFGLFPIYLLPFVDECKHSKLLVYLYIPISILNTLFVFSGAFIA